MTVETRTVAVLLYPERPEALEAAIAFMSQMPGLRFLSFSDGMEYLREPIPRAGLGSIDGKSTELVVIFRGDGTLLCAAEWAQSLDILLLGVNPGHVGFLAELETSDLISLPQTVIDGRYETRQRLVLRVDVADASGEILWSSSAVNEVSLEKLVREKVLNVLVHVDAHSLSQQGCDGVLVVTPTGSTAYAFSDGRPVVWPEVQATLLVLLSTHALFDRPMVLSPDSHVSLELGGPVPQSIIQCDGRRSFEVEPGRRMAVRTSGHPLRLTQFYEQHFTTRLVRKFKLPINNR